MNNIAAAAEKLKAGWCKGELIEASSGGDKFCAVGALGSELLGSSLYRPTYAIETAADRKDMNEYLAWENSCYDAVHASAEARVIAQTIIETEPDRSVREDYIRLFDRRCSEIIYMFNDNQLSAEPVIQIFEKAAAKWDEYH